VTGPVRALSVDLAERAYPVLVGPGARHEIARFLPPGAKSAVIVTQEAIRDAGWVDGLNPGLPATTLLIPDGEDAKTLATVEDLARRFARAGLSRADVVVAVGGGIVTDVAGFAAATYHRGTPYVNVATTLLGQVDAAIGGKTGVNLPEGKNLVGAFWQPTAVLCDTETLSSLPPREWACGRGEIAKYAFLGDGPQADQPIEEQVARCVGIKAAVVAEDDAWCSTTATPWPTRSRRRRWRTTTSGTCATGRPWPSGSSSRPSWRSGSVASTSAASTTTAR
jgi:5-deoxy-5-amino-3-dehydroquinate synthase